MSLLLPPENHPAREMLDVAALARRQWITLADAKASAKKFFATDGSASMVRSLSFQVIRFDDTIELITIGPKGGLKTVWKFGGLH